MSNPSTHTGNIVENIPHSFVASSETSAITNTFVTNAVTAPSNVTLTSVLSSPDIIKSVSRNLTPPLPPSTCTSVKSHTENVVTSPTIPISDPLIDTNWPGRPKRNSVTLNPPMLSSVDEAAKVFEPNSSVIVPPRRQRRQMSSPTLKKAASTVTVENDKNGNLVKGNSTP